MSVVTVEIGGQRYPIRSGLDERYIAELAAYVDQPGIGWKPAVDDTLRMPP